MDFILLNDLNQVQAENADLGCLFDEKFWTILRLFDFVTCFGFFKKADLIRVQNWLQNSAEFMGCRRPWTAI